MKLEFSENDYGTDITLKPETPAEVAQLFRMTRNAKAGKADIFLSFSSSDVYANVRLNKKAKNNHVNYVNQRTIQK